VIDFVLIIRDCCDEFCVCTLYLNGAPVHPIPDIMGKSEETQMVSDDMSHCELHATQVVVHVDSCCLLLVLPHEVSFTFCHVF
jgi:hypothetical protein